MTGTQGNPAGDVARTYLILKFGRVSDDLPEIQALISHHRDLILENYLNQYLVRANWSLQEIIDWIPPVAAARLCEWIPNEEKTDLVKVIQEAVGTGKDKRGNDDQ